MTAVATAGCSGGAGLQAGRGRADDRILVKGSIALDRGKIYAIVLLEARDGITYVLHSSRIADELRQLAGMDVALTGTVVRTLQAGRRLFETERYELLALPSGQTPIVGIVRNEDEGVSLMTEEGFVYHLEGEVPVTSDGMKIWVVGRRRFGVMSLQEGTLFVTEYGIISPPRSSVRYQSDFETP
jgi:hypothetical protein